MHLTLKHYYNFEKKLNKENTLLCPDGWDSVRLDSKESPFAIPRTIEAYEKKLKTIYKQEANDISNVIMKYGFNSIFSIGCGCGYVEANLKKLMPELYIVCSDFNEKSISKLKTVAIGLDELKTFDMMQDKFLTEKDQLYLLFRIDTELSDQGWNQVFSRMNESQVEDILIVATEILDSKKLLEMVLKTIIKRLYNYTFCGYLRTKSKYESLWGNYYKIVEEMKIGDLTAYLLKINK